MGEPTNVTWHPGAVDRTQREGLTGGRGATLWFTGLSGSGKSTVATLVEQRLVASGRAAYRLDGDNLRTGLNADLGFTREDRLENCRRVAEVARLVADAGMVAIVAVITPYEASRRHARAIHEAAGLPYVEVYMSAPAEVCAERDPKGLYRKVSAGTIGSFTGVDDPYEVPEQPDLALGADLDVEASVGRVLAELDRRTGGA